MGKINKCKIKTGNQKRRRINPRKGFAVAESRCFESAQSL
jgi:hypothetical protein